MVWQVIFLVFTLTSIVTSKADNNACKFVADYHFSTFSRKCSYNPDVKSNMISIIERHSFKVKEYSVTTNDGYILNLFQISSPKVTVSKFPIFMLHGIAIDAESWVAQANESLAFNLVERGYDVWVGTIRGTIDANEHETLRIDDPDYWDYNLDTLATEDVPIQLKFVSENTGQKLLYIGHSMGTTLSFMFTSENPEDANKLLRGVVALAPVAYLNGVPLIELIRPIALGLLRLLQTANIKGILYHEDIVHDFLINLCKLLPELCYVLVSTLPGPSQKFPPEDLLLFFSYWPAGMSIFELRQYLQIAGSKRFQKYDYGTEKNNNIYGSTIPPAYNLSDIEVPYLLFYGKNDILYRKENIERLSSEIGNSIKFETKVPEKEGRQYDFNHMDFLFSENIEEFLYQDLFEEIESRFG